MTKKRKPRAVGARGSQVENGQGSRLDTQITFPEYQAQDVIDFRVAFLRRRYGLATLMALACATIAFPEARD